VTSVGSEKENVTGARDENVTGTRVGACGMIAVESDVAKFTGTSVGEGDQAVWLLLGMKSIRRHTSQGFYHRDYTRRKVMETAHNVKCFSVSCDSESIKDRHLNSNFNQPSFVSGLMDTFGPDRIYGKVFLDYHNSSKVWALEHWHKGLLINFVTMADYGMLVTNAEIILPYLPELFDVDFFKSIPGLLVCFKIDYIAYCNANDSELHKSSITLLARGAPGIDMENSLLETVGKTSRIAFTRLVYNGSKSSVVRQSYQGSKEWIVSEARQSYDSLSTPEDNDSETEVHDTPFASVVPNQNSFGRDDQDVGHGSPSASDIVNRNGLDRDDQELVCPQSCTGTCLARVCHFKNGYSAECQRELTKDEHLLREERSKIFPCKITTTREPWVFAENDAYVAIVPLDLPGSMRPPLCFLNTKYKQVLYLNNGVIGVQAVAKKVDKVECDLAVTSTYRTKHGCPKRLAFIPQMLRLNNGIVEIAVAIYDPIYDEEDENCKFEDLSVSEKADVLKSHWKFEFYSSRNSMLDVLNVIEVDHRKVMSDNVRKGLLEHLNTCLHDAAAASFLATEAVDRSNSRSKSVRLSTSQSTRDDSKTIQELSITYHSGHGNALLVEKILKSASPIELKIFTRLLPKTDYMSNEVNYFRSVANEKSKFTGNMVKQDLMGIALMVKTCSNYEIFNGDCFDIMKRVSIYDASMTTVTQLKKDIPHLYDRFELEPVSIQSFPSSVSAVAKGVNDED